MGIFRLPRPLCGRDQCADPTHATCLNDPGVVVLAGPLLDDGLIALLAEHIEAGEVE